MHLLELPQELLDQVLGYLPPGDIVHYGRTCKKTYASISPAHRMLWQSAFLQLFDDPQQAWSSLTPTARRLNAETERSWDWYASLKQRLHTLRLYAKPKEGVSTSMPYSEKIAALLDLVDTAKPGPATFTAKSENDRLDGWAWGNINLLPTPHHWTDSFDQLIRLGDPDVSIPELPVRPEGPRPGPTLYTPTRPTTRSMSAAKTMHRIIERPEVACRLHVLAGMSAQEREDQRSLGLARRIVYDWDNTGAENDYGPFKSDGNVDWRRLEAVMSASTGHFSRAVLSHMSLPQGFEYSVPHLTPVDPGIPGDWAGVTRSWCGTYVFLNWENLLEFNALADLDIRPSLEDGPESCGGLMKLELGLDAELSGDDKLRPGLPICEDLPPLYFSGVSRSWDFQMATAVRGVCCLTPNGREVRWRFIINYSGADQWQLEGVQPGGIRSGCVYGLWTSCGHEEGGPVGPFIYAPEELCKSTATVLHSLC